MTTIMLIVLLAETNNFVQIVTEQMQFRTQESCNAASVEVERRLYKYKAIAVCIDRSNSEK